MLVWGGVGCEIVCFLAPVRGVEIGAVVRREEIGVSWECVIGRGGRGIEPECVAECNEDLVWMSIGFRKLTLRTFYW